MTAGEMTGTEAFRALKRENDALKAQVDQLKSQVKKLKQQLPAEPRSAKV